MKHADAKQIAENITAYLRPFTHRIAIAGSIRRLKDDVKDIEIVAAPILTEKYDLFGQKTGEHSMLNDRTIFEQLGQITKAGNRYVQVALLEGINLDMFIVLPPANWGVIMTIRTGPANFSHWIVTNRSKGGALHNGYKCVDGRIVTTYNTELEFTEEIDFLKWLDLGWIEPEKRQPKWNYFPRTYR